MRHGSLFSGIGGFDLAAEWMGWENVFHCEWNPFGQRVLHHYWPNAETFTDITKTDFTKYYGSIDIVSGGFPCQPYSSAGKRKGKEDERHLWPEMCRAIREISPSYVVGENVRGLTNWNGGLVFDEVCAELESLGYQVAPVIIPACAVNAPHKRERIWFVAKNTGSNGCLQREFEQKGTEIWQQRDIGAGSSERLHISKGDATNATGFGFCGNGTAEQSQSKTFGTWNGMGEENVTNAQCGRGLQRIKNLQSQKSNGVWPISDGRERHVTDTSSRGIQRHGRSGEIGEFQTNEFNKNNRKRQPRMDWEKFPTQPPICGGDDGLSTKLDGLTFPKWRSESIKAYGNAIVPQVAYEIFKAIEKTI